MFAAIVSIASRTPVGVAARCTMPVMSYLCPSARKAAASVQSSCSTASRSAARKLGVATARCRVSTQGSPRSSRARAVCEPMNPSPPVISVVIGEV
jgi:hypothetical protein